MRPSKKDELVSKSITAFNEGGFHALGMDALAARIGLSKTSIYNHFPTKEALIAAALEERDQLFRARFDRAQAAAAPDPRSQFLSIFDALALWFAADDFRGCMFIKAAAEFQDAGAEIYQLATRHKQAMEAMVLSLAAKTGTSDPARLARSAMLLMEGAIVLAQMGVGGDPARDARRAAEDLLDISPGH